MGKGKDDEYASEEEEDQALVDEEVAAGEELGEEGGGKGGEEDDDEEEEEGPDEYENDGWMVDEEEEEGEGGGEEQEGDEGGAASRGDEEEEAEGEGQEDEEQARKKKKTKKRPAGGRVGWEELELDEDDYDLLEEAGVHAKKKAKKFKRLKKKGRSEFGGEDSLFDREGEEEDGDELSQQRVARDLFGDQDGLQEDDFVDEREETGYEEGVPEDEGFEGDEEDEMGDFIVDGAEGEEGGSRRRRRQTVHSMPGVTTDSLMEAQDIFGDVSELIERRQMALAQRKREEEQERMEEGMAGGEYEHEGGLGMSGSVLATQYEPSLLEEKFLTARDNVIRETDAPERLQLLEEMVGTPEEVEGEEENFSKEAEWVFDRVFGMSAPPTVPERERREFQRYKDVERSIREIKARYGKDQALEEEDQRRVGELQQEGDGLRHDAVLQIENVLRELHVSKVEVPYIAMHKPGICDGIFPPDGLDTVEGRPKLHDYAALWAVQEADKKYRMLQKRKRSLRGVYQRPRQDPQEESMRKGAVKGVLLALEAAQSMQQVDDVDAKFNLQFPPEDAAGGGEGGSKQPKRVRRKSYYVACSRAGLKAVVACLGLSAYKLGENLKFYINESLYEREHEVEQVNSTPEEVATDLVSSAFPSVEKVLAAARHMAEVEIGIEPGVRHYMRTVFMEKAVVSTEPTPRGRKEIDDGHRYCGMEWLRDKPLAEFTDEQWLLIAKAEKEGLLKATLGLPPVELAAMKQHFEASFLSDQVSRFAQLWNEERRKILEAVLSTRLLPHMVQEARITLAARARAFVAESCAQVLWKRVSMAPYDVRSKASLHREDDEELLLRGGPWLRVLACCWGPGKPATTFAMLDANGELIDFLHCGFICARPAGPEQQMLRRKKEDDLERLRQFLLDHKPHIVVLGASNMACRTLNDEISETIFTVVERHPREMAREVDNIMVLYEDETVACLYENSQVSQEQLPDRPGIVRRAVGLGRYCQNRLALMANLFGPKKDILALKLHPAQDLAQEEELYEALERVMVTVTNQVGVDVNLGITQDWLFAPLQFVAGLGPRKGSSLRAQMVSQTAVRRRKDLTDDPYFLGPIVFFNAATGIRLRAQEDILDDTRIHPTDYRLALRVAIDVYCEKSRLTPEAVERQGKDVIVEVRSTPNIIADMNLEGYAERLREDGEEEADVLKLPLILRELTQGYAECREEFRALTQDEEFLLLSGETEETLARERLVSARIKRVQPSRVTVELESGVLGVIERADFSDNHDLDVMATVREGNMVTCRIKEVQRSKYMVELKCRGSDLRSKRWREERKWDRFYSMTAAVEAEDRLKAQAEERRAKSAAPAASTGTSIVPSGTSAGSSQQSRPKFRPRMITHPLFKNISSEDAVKELEGREIGAAIVRPSTRGPTNLTISLKWFDGIFVHVDVAESGKDRRDVTSFLRLGKTLTIGDDSYEDLDEVMARFIEPVVAYLQEMLAYRKFRAGTKAKVDAALLSEKAQNSKRIPYFISPSFEHPGMFRLSYVRTAHPKHEYISITPRGFRFRSKDHPTADHLVRYFQQHVNDDIAGAGAARAPSYGAAPSLSGASAGAPAGSNPRAMSDQHRAQGSGDGAWQGSMAVAAWGPSSATPAAGVGGTEQRARARTSSWDVGGEGGGGGGGGGGTKWGAVGKDSRHSDWGSVGDAGQSGSHSHGGWGNPTGAGVAQGSGHPAPTSGVGWGQGSWSAQA